MLETFIKDNTETKKVPETLEDLGVSWNVISDNEFKTRAYVIFKEVAKALSRTLGPYGSHTIIEQYGEMHFSKDGWQVIKNIRCNDMISNNIMALIRRISFQVVNLVGDGSTTAIVSANEIYKEFTKYMENHSDIRPKELIDSLNGVIDSLSKDILQNSTKVDDNFEDIKKLAIISTNGDTTIANIIQTIYRETGNPSIEYMASKTMDTMYEIIDGYKLPESTYLDSIYINGDGENVCKVRNPHILIIDHMVRLDEHYELIKAAKNMAAEDNTRLVVFAPSYDKFILSKINAEVNMEYRAFGTSGVVYCRTLATTAYSKELLSDFAMLCGATIYDENHHIQYIDEYRKKLDADGVDAEGNPTGDPKAYYGVASNFVGKVSSVNIGEKDTTISGFMKRNDAMYKAHLNDAKVKYDKHFQFCAEKGVYDIDLTLMKSRYTRLLGKMGIIYVGGTTTLEKNANLDLVEDAVKACESAYQHGYNIGGTLIIPHYCYRYIHDESLSIDIREMYEMIYNSFRNVFKIVMKNKYGESLSYSDDKYLDNIIDTCISIHNGDESYLNTKPRCYDLINEEYSDDVINSCMTDINVLSAAANIVSLLASSNQYISIQVNEKE